MRRGTTLIELMVVMAIWAAIMSAVLGFYIYGTKVSKRQSVLSQQLRQVQELYNQMVGRLTNAVVRDITLGIQPAVVYVRTRTDEALLINGLLPNWRPHDEILAVVPDPNRLESKAQSLGMCGMLVVQENNQMSTLYKLPIGMIASFEQDPTGKVFLQVKVPKLSSQAPDIKQIDVADMYSDSRWTKVTRSFLIKGWRGATVHPPPGSP